MDFEILIAGTDANAYYMARCYHELTGQRARLLGKSPLPFTAFSDILTIKYDENIWDENGFLDAVYKLKIPDKKTLLISSNETYAGFIAKNGCEKWAMFSIIPILKSSIHLCIRKAFTKPMRTVF